MQQLGIKQERLRGWHWPQMDWKKRVALVLGTGVVAICAHIAVPLGFTPIPVTMQTFAVLLLGLLLSPTAAFGCLALYLGEGAVGMPVFSPHGPGGIAQLLGPSGGYLLAYPFAAALAAYLYRRGRQRFVTAIAAAGLGSLVVLASGALWLGLLTHANFSALFAQSVAPFLAGDALKVLAAAACARMLASFHEVPRDRTL